MTLRNTLRVGAVLGVITYPIALISAQPSDVSSCAATIDIEVDAGVQPIDADPCWRSKITHFATGTPIAAKAQIYHGVPELRDDFILTGAGVTVGVWDVFHVQEDHQEFIRGAKRVTVKDPGEINRVGDHATHVAGIIGASGENKAAKGMAPGSRIYSYHNFRDTTELRAAPPEVSITNHSYGFRAGWQFLEDPACKTITNGVETLIPWNWTGKHDELEDPRFGLYDSDASAFDRIVAANQHLSVFRAAGNERGWVAKPAKDQSFNNTYCAWTNGRWFPGFTNGTWVIGSSVRIPGADGGDEGYDTLIGPALSKNVITIGAMRKPQSLQRLRQADVVPADFSSFGPTDDGRIKPDVVLHGEDLFSASPPDQCKTTPCPRHQMAQRSHYVLMGGTSMASPVAAGIAALLNELSWKRKRKYLLADEMKAVLIHTALSPHADMSPDYRVGWGAVQAQMAGRLVAQTEGHLATLEVTPGMPMTLKLEWKPNALGRITAAWIDEGGTPTDPNNAPLNGRTGELVKDVDLLLESPTADKYFAWSLDPVNPKVDATRSTYNKRDNVERIDVPMDDRKTAAPWTLTIAYHPRAGASNPKPLRVSVAMYGFRAEKR